MKMLLVHQPARHGCIAVERGLRHLRDCAGVISVASVGDTSSAVNVPPASALREQAVRTQSRALELAAGGSPGLSEQLRRYREAVAD